MKCILVLITIPLGLFGQIFKQDFNSSAVISTYVNASSPSTIQFNAIGSSGAGVIVSINSGNLRFNRSGSNAGSFSRTTDFAPTPSTMMYKFDLTISGNSAATTTAAVFQIGSGYGTANSGESNANTHSRLGLNISATSGQFSLRDIGTGTNTSIYSGTQSITWVVNNSGATLTYTAPNGTTESIADDKADLWISTTREFDDINATTSTQFLTDLKFAITNGIAIIDIDNININKLCINPITLNSSTATSNTEQCFDNGWHYYGTSSANYFGIKKNDNTFTSSVDLTVGSTISKTSSNGANQEHGMFLMGRYWNVDVNSGSITTPVDVRFFYDPSELAAAKTSRDASYTALPVTSLAVTNGNTAEWFKNTNGVPFDASYIASIVGNKFPSTYVKFPSATFGTLNGITYAELTGINSFSGGTGAFSYGPQSISSGNALPVSWGNIDVKSADNGYELNWQTYSERQSKYFNIEYSYDGKEFSELSGKIIAAGYSQSIKDYQYFHNDKMGKIYYRIKQVDVENNYEYSRIVIGNNNKSKDYQFTITPTLIDGKILYINSSNKITDHINIEIYDMVGKVLFTTAEWVTNNYLDKEYNLSHLAHGRYFVKLKWGNQQLITKIEKL